MTEFETTYCDTCHAELETGQTGLCEDCLNKKRATLPPDPEGQNEDRADWAGEAVRKFQRETGTDEEDAVSDLIADLGHWCDRNGQNISHEIARAINHYTEETDRQGTQFAGVSADVKWETTAPGEHDRFRAKLREMFPWLDDDEREDDEVSGADVVDKLAELYQNLREETRSEQPQPIPRVILILEGGLVQQILSDAPVEVATIDYDTDEGDPDVMTAIPQSEGKTADAYTGIHSPEITPDRLAELWAVVAAHEPTDTEE